MSASGLPAPVPNDEAKNKLGCSSCAKTEVELSRCSKCKSVCYCSKDCQQKDWPSHKRSCIRKSGTSSNKPSCNTGNPSHMPSSNPNSDFDALRWDSELFMKGLTSPAFSKYLQACFILHFDLLRFPRTDKPFIAQITVGNEPQDFRDFVKIFTGQPLGNGNIKGMVQLMSFYSYPPAEAAETQGWKRQIWELERERLLRRDDAAGLSVGIVQMTHIETYKCLAVGIIIDKPALDFVRTSKTLKYECPRTGKVIREVPLNVATCMEYLNTRIRDDLNDKMSLRTEMRPSDIKAIRDANGPRAYSDSYATLFLRGKMAREEIYRPLIRWTTEDYPLGSEPEVGGQA
ncbi:MYND-type domain-containing protein [Mycena venus]|uniref:MYND-type domain-containing protein n=1 Tax=Mycena venus TaxID=2733690 RepID=A0A8H6X3J1_9AGAR|nr:MYND-type domain-containing protein [Mycena venus]